MFKNLKLNFKWPSKKKERLFKVVYTTHVTSREYRLLVTGEDTVSAVKNFYKMAGIDKVKDIVEFTEIHYDNVGCKDEQSE